MILVSAGASWVWLGIFALPAMLFVPGWGWAIWLNRKKETTTLQLILDSCWVGLATTWVNIWLIRELGFGETLELSNYLYSESLKFKLLILSLLWTGGGIVVSRKERIASLSPKREKWGMLAVLVAVVFMIPWKSSDLFRPLDKYWYLEGAVDESNEYVSLSVGRHWAKSESLGDQNAVTLKLTPIANQEHVDLTVNERISGPVTIAVHGPIGSYVTAPTKTNESKVDEEITAIVDQAMAENPDEGPVRRYLSKGIAAVSVWIDRQPGNYYGFKVKGDEVYVFSSMESVWDLHGSGILKYVHYYQILNQVENQVWAEQMLVDRRFTWNQPPGWSPILSTASVLVVPDLPGAGCLFLWVLVVVGFTAVRLASLAAPQAETIAFLIPAALVLVHGFLMVEPASHNFPDSLYAAAMMSVFIALFDKRTQNFGWMGVATQALRWPGAIVATIFWGLHTLLLKPQRPLRSLAWLWGFVTIGILATAIAMAIFGLHPEDSPAEGLLDILYFETFPEHWGDRQAEEPGQLNLNPTELVARMPLFYGLWMFYSGGTLLLILPFLFGRAMERRKNLQFIFGSAVIYSLFLATIDHHPTHYFLPLVALTGPALITASDCARGSFIRKLIIVFGLIGIGLFLWYGSTELPPTIQERLEHAEAM